MARGINPAFWARLNREIEGNSTAGLFSRGRYATDASMYQCFPAGVAWPKTEADVAIIVEMAREEGLSIAARGGGTSTAGQALGEGLAVDFSRHLHGLLQIDEAALRCTVQPGMTPSALNRALRPSGLTFPVAISSGGQATLGGMLANNASGVRALRYGRMADNVASADVVLSDGQSVAFSAVAADAEDARHRGRERLLDLLQFGEMNEAAIARLWPKPAAERAVAQGYGMAALLPSLEPQNLMHLIGGSEGTLGLTVRMDLKLVPRCETRALGICRFESLRLALRAVPDIVALDPSAVELLDTAILDAIAAGFPSDPQAARLCQGGPRAALLVEFDRSNPVDNTRLLKELEAFLGQSSLRRAGVIEVIGQKAQAHLWGLRREAVASLLSGPWAARPIGFLEDGAVPLANLAAYGATLEELFARHGVAASIYGHTGQGTLHVQPMVAAASAPRAMMEDMTGLLREYGGALTSGYGIGLARGEPLERAQGQEAARLVAELKSLLDPTGSFNPGRFLRPPRFDDTAILRGGGPFEGSTAIAQAAAVCTGLSLCRALPAKFSCPSFAVTGEERDSPRGRANSVRLAARGELGGGALGSAAMMDTMRLCVACKACAVSCPRGIDIPRLKAETLQAGRAQGGSSRAAGYYARLPLYSARARKLAPLLRLRNAIPALARASERLTGIDADRQWANWSLRPFVPPAAPPLGRSGLVALFADTFNHAFEPANLRAAANVLAGGGYGVARFADENADAPLCCGRTFYDAGFLDEARAFAGRFALALGRYSESGIPVAGLEPLCVLMVRDEYKTLGIDVQPEARPRLFEEFVAAEAEAGRFAAPFRLVEAEVLLQPHCHERALGVDAATKAALGLVPGLIVKSAPPSCCGLNGPVGLTPDTFEASLAMAELALFPAIRKADRDTLIAATGFSCRKQIADGMGRKARHPARLLHLALNGDAEMAR